MISKFSNWLLRQANGLIILILIALLVVFNRFLFPYFIVHFGPGEGMPLLDTLFGFRPDQANYLLSSYGEAGRQGYITTIAVIDSLYPFVYGGLMAFSMSWTLKMTGFHGTSLQKLNLLPVTAMIFDFVENAGILGLLKLFPHKATALAGFTSIMGMAKWVLVFLSILIIIGLSVWGLISSLKRK
ncbi:MAG: hypothetical protein V2I46_09800 [Bacteroides sp.]|jgi:hypothetical protein|nr:hypothetical protein [Bacteroides sp.]